MKHFFLTFPVTLFLALSLSAQQTPLQKALGSPLEDYAREIKRTADSGFILTSTSYNPPNNDSSFARAIKLDSNMNMVWEKTFAMASKTNVNTATPLTNGQFLFGGDLLDPIQGNRSGGWLMKTNNTGTPIWSKRLKTVGNESVSQVFSKTNGDFLSIANNYGGDPTQTIATRFTTDGIFQNAFTLKKGNDGIRTNNVRQLSNNSFIATGVFYGVYNKFVVAKFNDSTQTPTAEWAAEYSSPTYSNLDIFDMQADPMGNIYLVGRGSFASSSSEHIFVLKLSASGDVLWMKNLVAPTDIYGGMLITGLTVTASDVTIIGSLYTRTFTGYALIAKLTTAGSLVWARRMGGTQNEIFKQVIKPSNKGLNIFGSAYHGIPNTNNNLYLLQTDSLGRSGGCFMDTLALTTTDITLPKTVFTPTFPSVTPTIETDTMRLLTNHPLSMVTVCGQTACTAPDDPPTLVGNALCTAAPSIKTLPTLRWRKTATLYNVSVYELPNTDAVWTANCVTDTFVQPSFTFKEGVLYRWNVVAVKGSCTNIECLSAGNNFKYFSKAFSIFKNDTAYTCPGSYATLSTNIFSSSFVWLKNNQPIPMIYTGLYQTNEAGEYKLRYDNYNAGPVCPVHTLESAPVIVKNEPAFPLTVKADTSTICPDKVFKLIASGSPSRFYTWSGDRLFAVTANQGDSVATVTMPRDGSGTYIFFTTSVYRECSITTRTDLVVSPTAIPSVTIAVDSGCPSRKLRLNATPTNGGTAPTFVWYRNQNSIGTGKTFTYINATNGDKITARMTIGQGICTTKPLVSSDTTTISCINTGINDIEGLRSCTISPNPSSGIFELRLSLAQSAILTLKVRNMLGQIIYQNHPLSIGGSNSLFSEQIDLSTQSKGLYWVETWINNKVIIQKVVIQ